MYVPAKNDNIDKLLSVYINNGNNEHLKILFLRQTEGVYIFGSKKVLIKLEKTELKVRVGGGYLSIDEFVEQFVNIELEKMDKLNLQTLEQRRVSTVNYGGKCVTGLGSIPESLPKLGSQRRS